MKQVTIKTVHFLTIEVPSATSDEEIVELVGDKLLEPSLNEDPQLSVVDTTLGSITVEASHEFE